MAMWPSFLTNQGKTSRSVSPSISDDKGPLSLDITPDDFETDHVPRKHKVHTMGPTSRNDSFMTYGLSAEDDSNLDILAAQLTLQAHEAKALAAASAAYLKAPRPLLSTPCRRGSWRETSLYSGDVKHAPKRSYFGKDLEQGGKKMGSLAAHLGLWSKDGSGALEMNGKSPPHGLEMLSQVSGIQQTPIQTITYMKDGSKRVDDLGLKDVLRYIQSAVRSVHAKEQEMFALQRGESLASSTSAYTPSITTSPASSAPPALYFARGHDFPNGHEHAQLAPAPGKNAWGSGSSNSVPYTVPPPYGEARARSAEELRFRSDPSHTMDTGGLHRTATGRARRSSQRLPPEGPFPRCTPTSYTSCGSVGVGGGMGPGGMPGGGAGGGGGPGGMLNARDIRRLCTGLDSEAARKKEMSIAVRKHTVILNLDELRCLVFWDRLIVLVPEGADPECHGRLEANLNWLRLQKKAFAVGEGGGKRGEGGAEGVMEGGAEEEEEGFEFVALEVGR